METEKREKRDRKERKERERENEGGSKSKRGTWKKTTLKSLCP